MKDKLQRLETEIKAIKKEVMTLGDLRPGTLSEQYTVCSNPECSCKNDPASRHGPYYQLSFTRKGKSETDYIKKIHLAETQKHIQNYKRLNTLLNRWIDLSIQICRIKINR